MKFIDDFMEKKTQDTLRKENEQIERKARLSELESRNKQKRSVLLHPVKSANERKEIKDLKKEISAYEQKKEDKVVIFAAIGVLVGFILLLCLSSAFHKPSDDNTDANETIVAETNVETEEENTIKGNTNAETVAIRDEQSNIADSTTHSIVASAGASDESDKTVDQEKTESEDEALPSANTAVQGIRSSDLMIVSRRDYNHVSNDSDYIGNGEGITLTIEVNKGNIEIEDLVFDYDTSLLNVDIEEPSYQDGKTIITAYVTANSECDTELFITTENEVEMSDEPYGYPITIRKLDSSEGRIAYITPTGTKYHFDANCAGENAVRTTYHDVMMLEIEPCGTCAD